jgi:hypothetical protein
MGIDAAYDITGDGNTAFGAYALRNVTSGSNNTAIGYSAGYTDGITSSAASVTNSTAIGAFAQLTTSNTIILGSANPAYATNVGIGLYNPGYKLHVNGTIGGSGAFVNASDGRLKKNVLPVQQALDKIKALRGVRFNWNQEAARQFGLHTDTRNHYGFIAQEVEKILPEVVHTGAGPFRVKTIAYTDIIPVLTAALKEQQPALDNLLQQHERMQQRLALLQQQLDTMEKQATP